MRTKSFLGTRCGVAGALDLVGDRWTLLLVRDLSLGIGRFDELGGELAIPSATLAARLRHMVEHEIVERVQYQDHPPRAEYRLTAKGRGLWKVLTALREWGDEWGAAAPLQPTVETVDGRTGQRLKLALVDMEAGRAVHEEHVRLCAGAGADARVRNLIARLYAEVSQ